ncbi:MAG: aminotransferase class V-fold PLP-dependent enzyme [Thermoproteota archaeon]
MLDPYKTREDFPSIAGEYIFMNNADSTGIPVPVLEKVLIYCNEVKGKPGSGSTPSHRAMELYEGSREKIFKSFGVSGNNILFSPSNAQSLKTILQSIELRENEVFIASSNVQGRYMDIIKEHVRRTRGKLEVIDVEVDEPVEKFKEVASRRGIKAALLNHISGATGTILQVDRIVPVLKDRNIATILDATYSVQRTKLNFLKMGVDYAYFKSGNMFSIDGVSVLYVSDERLNKVEKDEGHAFLKQFEEENHFGIIALAAAMNYLDELGLEDVLNHERGLAEEIMGIATGDGVTFYQANPRELRTGIFSLTVEGVSSNFLQAILEDQFHILGESGNFDSPFLMQRTGGREALRLSPTVFNTIEEARRVGEKLAEIREAYMESAVGHGSEGPKDKSRS